MIIDRKFPQERIKILLEKNNDFFIPKLSDTLKKRGISLDLYAEKLSNFATFAICEDSDNGNIKAAVIGYTHNLPDDNGAHITLVVTCAEYRNQGLCQKLLKEFIEYCEQLKISYIWLETSKDNLPARHVYETSGFKCVPTQDECCVKYIIKLNE